MRKAKNTMAAAACALALSACAAQVAPPAAPTVTEEIGSTARGGVRRQAVTIRAKVEKIDHDARKVSLVGFDGERETIALGQEVRNLDQVKKGDEVVVTYYQSAAFEVLKKGEKGDEPTVASGLARAEPGEMPGALAAELVTLVVDVLALDRDKSTATVRGPEGNTVTLDIHNPIVFDKVKVGDRVEVQLAEAVAIDVQPAPAQ